MNRFPFLVGTTSFVYHADILTNAGKLAPVIDDMELVLFYTEKEDILPSRTELNQVKEIAGIHNMGFTVHLPLKLSLGDKDETVRASSVQLATDIIHLTSCINPRAYIIHLTNEKSGMKATEKDWTAWTGLCCDSLETIISRTGVKDKLCIENLENYDISYLDEILRLPGISLCLDIGHLWAQGQNPVRIIEHYAEKIRVIHLHGINKRDHSSLACMDFSEIINILDALEVHHFSGVLTLEVFSYNDFITSLRILEKWVDGKGIP